MTIGTFTLWVILRTHGCSHSTKAACKFGPRVLCEHSFEEKTKDQLILQGEVSIRCAWFSLPARSVWTQLKRARTNWYPKDGLALDVRDFLSPRVRCEWCLRKIVVCTCTRTAVIATRGAIQHQIYVSFRSLRFYLLENCCLFLCSKESYSNTRK